MKPPRSRLATLTKMKFLIFLVIAFMFFALLIISNNDLSFLDDDNIKIFFNMYVSWLDKVFSNMGGVSGNVVESNWLP
jgi:hypothetical protein